MGKKKKEKNGRKNEGVVVCVKKIKIMGGRVEKWREVEDAPAVSRVWGKKNEEEKMGATGNLRTGERN